MSLLPLLVMGWLLTACSSTEEPVTRPETPVVREFEPPSEEKLSYLLDPSSDYPLMLDPQRLERAQSIFDALRQGGTSALVQTPAGSLPMPKAAEELRLEEPDLPIAAVLVAQAALVDDDCPTVLREVEPVVERLPDYHPARLLRARCRQVQGDVVEAFEDYRHLQQAGIGGAVVEGATWDLQARAIEIVSNRFYDALRRGRSDMAERELERLEAWSPDGDLTLEARWRLAASQGDIEKELTVVQQLFERYPDNMQLLERVAELEMLTGDPTTAVRLMTDLSQRFPDDPVIEDKLDAAKFRWRVSLLPAEIRDLADLPALKRADFAVLLHALLPGVRTGQTVRSRIASDILRHRNRAEIARVINLGLMDMDAEVHRFHPNAQVNRAQVLEALLRGLASLNNDPPACLGDFSLNTSPSVTRLCEAALQCRLLSEEAECLPNAEATGRDVVELLRLSIRVLDSTN